MDSIKGPWIHGFAIHGVRSLRGGKLVRVGPLGKINFLVGRNNHGKSTILRQAVYWSANLRLGKTGPPQMDARSDGRSAETLVPVRRDLIQSRARHQNVSESALVAQYGWIVLDDDHYGMWVDRVGNQDPQAAAKNFVSRNIGNPGRGNVIGPAFANDYVLIPAFRQLRPAPEDTPESLQRRPKRGPDIASGEGLIAELASWERPTEPGSEEYEAAGDRWRRLKHFLREVLEDPDADIEVASNQTDLHVQLAQAGRMLKIDDLGDGIKQILMIAAACVYYDGSFVCLEEPEIHLHAGLQRKLLRFLATQTSSQYLIATHSAHVLDLPEDRKSVV